MISCWRCHHTCRLFEVNFIIIMHPHSVRNGWRIAGFDAHSMRNKDCRWPVFFMISPPSLFTWLFSNDWFTWRPGMFHFLFLSALLLSLSANGLRFQLHYSSMKSVSVANMLWFFHFWKWFSGKLKLQRRSESRDRDLNRKSLKKRRDDTTDQKEGKTLWKLQCSKRTKSGFEG